MTLENIVRKLNEFIDAAPSLVGNEAVNFFKDNFDKEG